MMANYDLVPRGKLIAELEKLTAERDDAWAKLAMVKSELEQCNRDHAYTRHALSDAHAEIAHLNEMVAELFNEAAALRSDLADARCE